MKTRTIYTLGYERRQAAQVVAMLARNGVKALIDARNTNSGRYSAAEFRPEVLKPRLERAGIALVEAKPLGVPRLRRVEEQETEFEGYRMATRVALEDAVKMSGGGDAGSVGEDGSADASTGVGGEPHDLVRRRRVGSLAFLLSLVKEGDIAIMCKERKHERCHRTALAEEVAAVATIPGVMHVDVVHL